MSKQIKNKILTSIVPFAYAALDLKPQGSDFKSLESVSINSVVSGAITLALIIAVVAFFFVLILGAFRWITSTGDEKKVASARSQVTNALIGLVIIFATWAILSLINTIFNIEILGGFSIPSFTESSPSSTTTTTTTGCSSSNCGNCGSSSTCRTAGCKWSGGACIPYTISN